MGEVIIGTGIDITEVRRIKNAVEKWGRDFLERIFTEEEIKNAKDKPSLYQYLAGRFAAKEAVFKALGDKDLGWKDVQILNTQEGKPFCQLLNKNKKDYKIKISISHIKTYAVACAIVTKKT